MPEAKNHDGGGIKFGPDRNLYISTGGMPKKKNYPSILILSLEKFAGKILRIKDDGSVAK